MASAFGQRQGELIVIGASYRTSTAALRDRLFVEEATLPALLSDLRGAGLDQAVVLSTCDRSEVQALHAEAPRAAELIVGILARQGGVAPEEFAAQSYRLNGAAALRHVFGVAASLDSAVVGEPQILGQLKASHRVARDLGMVRGELEAILQAAYRTAKRVRSETAVAEQPTSIAAAAVQLARRVHGDLRRCGALLIGTGEMGELMVDQLLKAGLGQLTVLHPSARRAELAARRLGGRFLPIEALDAGLAAADIVVGSLGAGRATVSAALVRTAVKARRQRPILLLDAAVPNDVDPAAGGIDETFLYDLDDLERLAMQGRSTRAAAAQSGWVIVDQEVDGFLRKQAGRAGAAPLLLLLREHFERLRAEALSTARSGDAEEATRLLVNKLLHDPAAVLRALAAAEPAAAPVGSAPDSERAAAALCALFGLTGGAAGAPGEQPATPADGPREEDGD